MKLYWLHIICWNSCCRGQHNLTNKTLPVPVVPFLTFPSPKIYNGYFLSNWNFEVELLDGISLKKYVFSFYNNFYCLNKNWFTFCLITINLRFFKSLMIFLISFLLQNYCKSFTERTPSKTVIIITQIKCMKIIDQPTTTTNEEKESSFLYTTTKTERVAICVWKWWGTTDRQKSTRLCTLQAFIPSFFRSFFFFKRLKKGKDKNRCYVLPKTIFIIF